MVKQVAVLGADDRVVVDPFDGKRIGFFPFAFFPEASALGDFANINFWIKISGELVAMVASVGVHDVDRLDGIEEVLLGIGAEDIRDARVEARAQQGHQAGFFETFAVGPLPRVFELRQVRWFVVRGIDVVDAGVEAGVHQMKVLVGQGDVDEQIGAEGLDEGNRRFDIIGIHGGRLDGLARGDLDVRRDGLAFILIARGEHDFREGLGCHGAFVGDDVTDAAGSDNQDFLAHKCA